MATVQNVAFGGFAKQESVISKIIARFAAWNEERKTRQELERLSNAQLRDIGIYRSDIPAVSRGVFEGRRG